MLYVLVSVWLCVPVSVCVCVCLHLMQHTKCINCVLYCIEMYFNMQFILRPVRNRSPKPKLKPNSRPGTTIAINCAQFAQVMWTVWQGQHWDVLACKCLQWKLAPAAAPEDDAKCWTLWLLSLHSPPLPPSCCSSCGNFSIHKNVLEHSLTHTHTHREGAAQPCMDFYRLT